MASWSGEVYRKSTLAIGVGLLALGAGCRTLPYQPGTLYVPSPDPEAVLRQCMVALNGEYPGIARLEKGLLVTRWKAASEPHQAVRRRVELRLERSGPGVVAHLAVKRVRVGVSPFVRPRWVADGGDRQEEERLLRLLEEALKGRILTP